MRSLLLAVIGVLTMAAYSSAQETYSLPAGAGNVATLSVVAASFNGETCERFGLARTCTQAQACVAAGATGGSSCTAAQARSVRARIYPITFAGREEFVTFEVALPKFLELVGEQQREDRRNFCIGWNAASVSTRNTFCTTIGQPAGCNPGCN